MKAALDAVRLPSADESIAPVTILDAHGHVVRVVSAAEFRQGHATGTTAEWRSAVSRRHPAR
jgi:hypothetical protein